METHKINVPTNNQQLILTQGFYVFLLSNMIGVPTLLRRYQAEWFNYPLLWNRLQWMKYESHGGTLKWMFCNGNSQTKMIICGGYPHGKPPYLTLNHMSGTYHFLRPFCLGLCKGISRWPYLTKKTHLWSFNHIHFLNNFPHVKAPRTNPSSARRNRSPTSTGPASKRWYRPPLNTSAIFFSWLHPTE